MKNLRIALLLLAVPIASATASAQGSGSAAEHSSPRVVQARCRYTPNDPACQHRGQPNPNSAPSRPAPCRSPCRLYGYAPPALPSFLFEPEKRTHAAAGALIGLGLGAALGAAKNGEGGSRFAGALVVGGFGALIGAIVGHGVPARSSHRRHPDWDYPEENAMAPQPSLRPPAAPTARRASTDHPSGP